MNDYLKFVYKGPDIKAIDYLASCGVGKTKIESIRLNKDFYINDALINLETEIHDQDELKIMLHEKVDFLAYDNPISIVYEDDYVLIVNKGVGVLVHPDKEENQKTLTNMVANYYLKKGIERNVRYVHRIDLETTGIVVFAKDFLTHAYLHKALEENRLNRYYLGIISGMLEKNKGRIETLIGRDRHNAKKMRVSKTGKLSITNYELVKYINKHYSLVLFQLETGRTHQIRVHMSYNKTPLAGDLLYNGNPNDIKRVALHSYEVRFYLPFNNKNYDLKAELPHDMKKIIK